MATVNVEDTGKGKYKQTLMDFAARRALILIGQRIVLKAVNKHQKLAPITVATGQTRRSITATPPRMGTDGQGRYMEIKIGPRTKYAYWGTEFGRNPFKAKPPLRKIAAWVKEKPGGGSLTEREIYAIAKTVQKKVHEEGIQARFIMTDSLAEESQHVDRIIMASMMAVLKG